MLKSVSLKTLLIIALILIISCEKKEMIVAKVGDTIISKEDLIKQFKTTYRLDTFSSLTFEQKLSTVNQMVERKLKFLTAIDSGYINDDIIQSKAKNKAEMWLHSTFKNDVIREAVANNAEKKKLYENLKELVKVRNILIRFKGATYSKSKRSEEEALKLTDSLKSIIGPKGSFAFIAHKYSEGKYAENGGNMGFVTRAGLEEELVDVVFNAPVNEIIGPVKSKYGYHLFKVEKKKKNDELKSFTEMDPLLERFLIEKNAKKIKGILDQKYEQFSKEFQFKLNTDGIKLFIKNLTEWSSNPPLIIDSLFIRCKNIVLMESNGFKLYGGDYIFSVNDFNKVFSRFKTEEKLSQFLENAQKYYTWMLQAKKQGYENQTDFTYLKNKIIENLSVFKLETNWRMQTQISPQTVKEYYLNHKEKFKSDKDGKTKSFNEVQSQIERQLLAEGIKNLNRQMIDKIKEKYPVTIHEDIVRKIK